MAYTPKYDYAGFWKRFAAGAIDVIVVGIISAIIGHQLAIIGGMGYIIAMVYRYGATMGMLALDIRLVTYRGTQPSMGQIVGWTFAQILSALILYIGYLMIAWTEKKQGLHDKLAETYVVNTRA